MFFVDIKYFDYLSLSEMCLKKVQNPLKIAVVPEPGLGDGIISCIVAYNLSLVGHNVTLYHPILDKMAPLFPEIEILPRPENPTFLNSHQRTIIFVDKERVPRGKIENPFDLWMQQLLKKAFNTNRERLTILNPIATPNKNYPFWEEGEFDGTRPFVNNLMTYLREKEAILSPQCKSGITLPPKVKKRKHIERVILHPTSSRAGKNWTKSKYLKLAKRFRKLGLSPFFILTPEEAKQWPEVSAPVFTNLIELTYFIAESGYMVGNDSGIGHLASCLGVPTLTICRSKMRANFWRPAFSPGIVLTPSKWIPNLKNLRWRDRYWQNFVFVSQAEKAFHKLFKNSITSIT